MTAPVFDEPSGDELFYARALAILAGPTRRMAIVLRACGLLYWAAVLGALGWLCAQVIDRQVPVAIRSTELLTPELKAGEPIRVAYAVTRLRTCETDLTWSIYDGANEVHLFGPIHIAAAGLPGPDSFVRAWATSPNMSPGRGRLRVILAFSCPGNYLQAIYPVIEILPDLAVTIDPARSSAQNVGVPAGVGTSTGDPPGITGGSLQPGGSTTSPPGPGTRPGPGWGIPMGSPGESSPGVGG